MARPLEGIRVIDCTIVVAGPVGTGLLGDLGAEVIKVENTVMRQIIGVAPSKRPDGQPPPGMSQAQRAAGFHDLNRSKLGISLNLNLPEAREVFKTLVSRSDVVIDNFSPRVMRNFGLEYEDLVKVKPDIIAVSMPAFGKTGPFRDRTSFGPGIDALSGLSHLTGYPDSTPLKPGNYFCDYNAGVLAATAIMAALFRRRRTGKGQFIEVAMRDGLIQTIGESVIDYSMNGRVQQRAANRDPYRAPHNVYRCAGEDSWLAVSVWDDAEWRALCGAIGRPELADDPRFATAPARKAKEEALDREISSWTNGRDHIEAMHALQKAGVRAAAVMTTEEIAADPHFRARGVFQDVSVRDETIRLGRVGWRADHANTLISRAPEYSEHTEQVLRDLAGLDDGQIRRLADIGAIVLRQPAEVTS
jgi:crotonobetainyl-CoA:carnitine CoA-transferase CaiB-like acyl-CoA transferase